MRAGFAALLVAYVFSQFYRAFLAVLAPVLAADIGATPADLAFASGVWFAVFAAMQIPVGHALDTLGPRRTCGWLLVLAALGAAVFATAPGPGRRHPGDGADRRRLLGGADGLALHLRPRLPARGLRQPQRPRDRRRLGRQRRQRRADGLGRRGRRLAREPLGARRRHGRHRARGARARPRPAPAPSPTDGGGLRLGFGAVLRRPALPAAGAADARPLRAGRRRARPLGRPLPRRRLRPRRGRHRQRHPGDGRRDDRSAASPTARSTGCSAPARACCSAATCCSPPRCSRSGPGPDAGARLVGGVRSAPSASSACRSR